MWWAGGTRTSNGSRGCSRPTDDYRATHDPTSHSSASNQIHSNLLQPTDGTGSTTSSTTSTRRTDGTICTNLTQSAFDHNHIFTQSAIGSKPILTW